MSIDPVTFAGYVVLCGSLPIICRMLFLTEKAAEGKKQHVRFNAALLEGRLAVADGDDALLWGAADKLLDRTFALGVSLDGFPRNAALARFVMMPSRARMSEVVTLGLSLRLPVAHRKRDEVSAIMDRIWRDQLEAGYGGIGAFEREFGRFAAQ